MLRGSYERFATWTLDGYCSSNKASRTNPFKDQAEFAEVIEKCYDNKLRNASHHRRIQYDSTEGIVYYWPKSGVASKHSAESITIWHYLNLCYDIIQAFSVIVVLHHELNKHF